MAKTPEAILNFEEHCPDCANREVQLPDPLPDIGDDFDWKVRDYDSYRLMMMEELAARFPERTSWTAGDMEVVLVEALSAKLDEVSDMLDRVSAEAFLETARRPESVRRLLQMIGYDAVREAGFSDDYQGVIDLQSLWLNEPRTMELAKQAGPRAIKTQRRMVTEDDYENRLEEHPIVLRTHAWSEWQGSWNTMQVAVVNSNNAPLDDHILSYALQQPAGQEREEEAEKAELLWDEIVSFHKKLGLRDLPEVSFDWLNPPDPVPLPSIRTLLRQYVDAYRMVGLEASLHDAEFVGISMALSIRVADNYYQSEVRREVELALGTDVNGFFEPGNLRFGEDLHASDIFQTVMALDGVRTVCLNRFKRVGKRFPDQSENGLIILEGLEIAVCNNTPGQPEYGYFTLNLHGGQKG